MHSKLSANKGYILTFLIVLGLYVFTCAPTVLWQDSGMYQYRVWNNDIRGGLGLALAHPLYIMTGIAVTKIPMGDFAYKVNLVSAVCGAITVANIFLLVYLITSRKTAAVIGAITMALSHTLWQHSNIAEVYSMYAAFLSTELIVLFYFVKTGKNKFLYLLGFLNGLSIAAHMLGIIPLFIYLCFIAFSLKKKELKFKAVLIAAGFWIIGALPYEYLIVEYFLKTGYLLLTVKSMLFGDSWDNAVLNASLSFRMVCENFLFIGLNFPSPNILLIFVGLAVICKRANKRYAILLTALFVMFLGFAFRYTVPDRYAFFLSFYIMCSVFLGVGADYVIEKFKSKKLAIAILAMSFLALPVYYFAPVLAEKANVTLGTKRTLPYRNDYVYFLRPWQINYDGAYKFAFESLNLVEDNAVIIADGTTVYALWYVQHNNGIKPTVKIVAGHGDYKSPIPSPDAQEFERLITEHPIYVVSAVKGYCPPYVLENYQLQDMQVLTKVVGRKIKSEENK
jgi:hypothetical protein